MNKFKTTGTYLALLIAVICLAGMASAKDQTAPGAAFPGGNTPFPIHIGSTDQVKGINTAGGLSVGAFFARQDSGLNATSYIEGILTGNPQGVNNSLLAFGDSGSKVELGVNGTTYMKSGGMYSGKIIAPTGEQKTLCADNDGNIIFCPSAVVPPTPKREHYTSNTGGGANYNFGQNGRSDLADCSQCSPFLIRLDTARVLIDTLPGFTPQDDSLNINADHTNTTYEQSLAAWKPAGSHLWTVPTTGNYDITFSGKGTLQSVAGSKGSRWVAVGFFLRINDQFIPLNNPHLGYGNDRNCGASWNFDKPSEYDNAVALQSALDVLTDWKQYYVGCGRGYNYNDDEGGRITTKYDLQLHQTFALKAGDVISFVGKGAATAEHNGFFGQISGQMPVSVSVVPTTTEFRVKEL